MNDILEKYDYKSDWFVDYIREPENAMRVQNIEEMEEYLKGNHKIKYRSNEKFNGKEFEPRKIVLQYAKTILNFHTSYLLKNGVFLSGNENVVQEFEKVYKQGRFNQVDFDILESLIKHGEAYEYIYQDGSKIKSKVLNPEYSYPVMNRENELQAFIYAYCHDAIDYYTVYYPDVVETFNNKGGQLHKTGEYVNVSGLPVVYRNDMDEPRSDLEDYINIIDDMEDIISKTTDAYYKYLAGIPVSVGQRLKGEGLPSDVVGGGITLDDGGDFFFASNNFDTQGFEADYKQLMNSLLDISHTPAILMGKLDVSNLSEVSISMMYSLSEIKAGINERYLRSGFFDRWQKIRNILALQGITFNDDDFDTLDVVFQTMKPRNHSEIIENMQSLYDMGKISTETILENNPYVKDKQQEMNRLERESNRENDSG
ncbi:phage portal protein [Salibacterium qingdaonense]|uniref:Phage portal protein, SPP1 family n=1 Tax=Salibacterium qingdaonense TaxID=266892 RepID=A0A1I4QMN7_9BACI|nr:phage portal protein [Salibacterium qingdaonense]SFM41307.1 phage portal protein, SPP1 family [Salibacterium qingdaonense]